MPFTRAVRKINKINIGIHYKESDFTLGELVTMEAYTIGRQAGEDERREREK